jgi:hypothetical protein
VYVPESVPSVQVRDSEAQVWPYGTVSAWYAVTEEVWVMVWLLNVQEGWTVREALCEPAPPAPEAEQE